MHPSKDSASNRISRTYDIPSVPLVLTRILQVLADDKSTAKALEELILHDPALSARVLRLANSAFYAFRYEVRTISHAVSLLGLKVVKSLAIGVSIFESFTHGMKKEADLINGLWMHSFGTALLAQEIWARSGNRTEGEFAFLCGLLHDLGKVVFFKSDPAFYSRLFVAKKTGEGHDISSLERESFDADHAVVGALLAKKWGLPTDLATVIGEHHAPLASEMSLVSAVSLADILAKEKGIGYSGDSIVPCDLPALLERLGLGAGEYEQLASVAEVRRKEADSFFKM